MYRLSRRGHVANAVQNGEILKIATNVWVGEDLRSAPHSKVHYSVLFLVTIKISPFELLVACPLLQRVYTLGFNSWGADLFGEAATDS